jgi:hypothetical protein
MREADVKTYVWYGAASPDNSIPEMVNREDYGVSPLDVVDRITRECNIAVFLGGSGLCLEEVQAAIARNLLVIPIRLEGARESKYASSIIHSYLLNNADVLDDFRLDRTADGKPWKDRLWARYLTKKRLQRLDITRRAPEEVVKTVMEIIMHYYLEGDSRPVLDSR